jgi:hypothetical protein
MGIPFKDAGLYKRKDKKDREESILFKDAGLYKRKDKKTKLEIELHQCSHMKLNLEKVRTPFPINLGKSGATKIPISALYLKSEKDVLCRLTGKPCVLYAPGDVSSGLPPYINYSHLDWCPSSKDSTKKYKLRGKKKGSLFYTAEIERIKEEK